MLRKGKNMDKVKVFFSKRQMTKIDPIDNRIAWGKWLKQ